MSDVAKTIEAVWKIESTRLIAAIARVTHDIGIAEELAQDALVTALEVWPEEGIPDNPGAWLMKAAKRRAIDSLRRGRMLVQKHEEIARELECQQQRLGDALEHSLDQVMRAALSEEALRLGRMLGQLLPGESEVHALVALMELQASRNAARRSKNGEVVLLPDQDRSLWDYAQIQRGMTVLEQAQRLGAFAADRVDKCCLSGGRCY
jgi:predicted RNA polymerase sigma factor